MTTFYGLNGELLSVPVIIANKGIWNLGGQAADDGQHRDAATSMALAEEAMNRTVWLRYRFVNGLEGGTYPGSIAWTGNHTFNGGQLLHQNALALFQGTGNFSVLKNAFFTHPVSMSSTLTVSGATQLGDLTVLGAAQFGDPVVFTDVQTKLGDDAYTAGRKGTISDANVVIEPWKKDLWIVTENLAMDRSCRLAHPPNNEIVETTIMRPDIGTNEMGVLDDVGLNVVARIGAGELKSAVVIFDGSAWQVKASHPA